MSEAGRVRTLKFVIKETADGRGGTLGRASDHSFNFIASTKSGISYPTVGYHIPRWDIISHGGISLEIVVV